MINSEEKAHLAVRRAGYADADGTRGSVARHADHAHVVAEVLAAELRADAHLARHLQDRLLHLQVAEGAAELVAARVQVVEVLRGGQLHGLQTGLSGGSADGQRQVVRRTRGGAQRLDLRLDEGHQTLRRQQRLRLLEEVRLVGRAAALRHEHELVLVARDREEVDLSGEVGLRVHLLVHRQRSILAVAQVQLRVSVVTRSEKAHTPTLHETEIQRRARPSTRTDPSFP